MNSYGYIVVGLGNPGKDYENTRHNMGFRAVDFISEKMGIKIEKSQFKALTGEGILNGEKILLLKPQTYMNLSGQAVIAAMNFYKISSKKVIIIFDDISLPVGKMRIRKSGSHGGQNGIKNIIALSGTNEFPRIKIGIGEKPNPHWGLANWVLSKLSSGDSKLIDECLNSVYDALKMIVGGDIDGAMNKFN